MAAQEDRLSDRVRGTLIGLAAGDKNHGPSHMAWRLAQSLAERQRFDPEDIFKRYLAWHREGSFDTGLVAATVFEHAVAGLAPEEAVARAHTELEGLTAGVNTTHRVAPLAMAALIPDDDLEAAARRESALTHAHPLAGDSAAAIATLCRALIRGVSWEEALPLAAHGKSPEVRAALQPGSDVVESLSAGGFAAESLRAAIWHLHQAESFEEALAGSLAFAGPANYCPVLVGAIGGARWGASAIPARELVDHPLANEMELAAALLASDWG